MGTAILERRPLREVIEQFGALTEEDYICVEDKANWSPESTAYVMRIPKYTDLRTVGPIPDYFLEVFTAREVLENWSMLRGGRKPTVEEMCEALIHYARYDGDLLPENPEH